MRPKKIEKCLPAGTGTKIYFSSFVFFVLCSIEARGAEQGGETRLRGPEALGPLSFQALRASGEALQGPRRGVSVFKGAGKEGGPFRGP